MPDSVFEVANKLEILEIIKSLSVENKRKHTENDCLVLFSVIFKIERDRCLIISVNTQ